MADTMQRRSNLEALKLVMTVRQKYERVRGQWLRAGRHWHINKRTQRAIDDVARMYVRYNEKQFWHTNQEIDSLKHLADLCVERFAELHGHKAREYCQLNYGALISPDDHNPGDLWLLWHAELEGAARQEFLAQQGLIGDEA